MNISPFPNNARRYALRTDVHKSGTPHSGQKLSKFERSKFLAWDGEGMQRGSIQEYALLANSAGDFWMRTQAGGLSTRTCLEALTDERYTKNTIHVCFGASYDVNMMLRNVPENLLRILQKGEAAYWEEFRLEYRPRKSFSVTRYATEESGRILWNNNKPVVARSMVLWDVFGFFQKKFIRVLQEWFRGTPLEEKYQKTIDDIEKGKQKRGSFSFGEMKEFVLPYCINECRALQELMNLLSHYLKEADIVLSRWDGAGAVSSALLQKYAIREHIRSIEGEFTPSHIIMASEYAYFGGWVEAFKFGIINHPIYRYDIRSAYPWALTLLHSLKYGVWKTTNIGYMEPIQRVPLPQKIMWIAHISWECPESYLYGPGPFSWRGARGHVRRPLRGAGWQYGPEILAVLRNFPDIRVCVDCIHEFIPEKELFPFSFMKNMYERRAELKAQGNGMEKVLKLGMNSAYGKTAQSVGYDRLQHKKPPFHSALYAGLATSMARARIIDAVSSERDAIVSVCTDGIYSLKPLSVSVGGGLGEWEYTLIEGMTLVQAGFYWTQQGKNIHPYFRGFNENSVSCEMVQEAYRNEEKWSLPIKTTRFLTLGGAVGLNDFSEWTTWREKERNLDLYQQSSSKRVWLGEREEFDSNIRVARVRSYPQDTPLESSRYSFEWGDTFDGQSVREIVEEMFNDELSPESEA
jgi:hypothetical protein